MWKVLPFLYSFTSMCQALLLTLEGQRIPPPAVTPELLLKIGYFIPLHLFILPNPNLLASSLLPPSLMFYPCLTQTSRSPAKPNCGTTWKQFCSCLVVRGKAPIRDVHFGATEIIISACREREIGGKWKNTPHSALPRLLLPALLCFAQDTCRKFSLKKQRLETPPGTSGVHWVNLNNSSDTSAASLSWSQRWVCTRRKRIRK